MFFKGGKLYKGAKDVAGAIDEIGGDFNDFTGKEYVGYYVKCANEYVETAFKVLSDMIVNAPFLQSEIDKERGVIIEELNMYLDTPMYQVSWDFERFVIGDQALGWDTIGLADNINSFKTQDFIDYTKSLYTTDNMVISVCGGISKNTFNNLSEQYFSEVKGLRTAKNQ